jgi:hypothetical protein
VAVRAENSVRRKKKRKRKRKRRSKRSIHQTKSRHLSFAFSWVAGVENLLH